MIAALANGGCAERAGAPLPPQASLADVSGDTPAILRAARTQPGTTLTPEAPWPPAERISFVVRVYTPDATGSTAAPVSIAFPNLALQPDLEAVAVTALEEPVDSPAVTVSDAAITFTPAAALTTLQVTVTRPRTTPGNGKPIA